MELIFLILDKLDIENTKRSLPTRTPESRIPNPKHSLTGTPCLVPIIRGTMVLMRRIQQILIGVVLFGMCALPVFAQSEGEFYNALQDNLPRTTSSQPQTVPQAGTSERVIVSSTPTVDATSTYGAYNAGQDQMSGYLAAGAAVVAALIIAFALGFVLTHPHHSTEADDHVSE